MKRIDEIHKKINRLGTEFTEKMNKLENLLLVQVHKNENGWTVIDILRHIIVSEKVYIIFLKNAIDPSIKIPNKLNPSSYQSVAEYNSSLQNSSTSDTTNQLREDFLKNQQALLKLLKSIRKVDLKVQVNHHLLNKNIDQFLDFMFWHSNHHLEQINGAIKNK
ncbi:MAG: DinB family protein [Candidatus Heimdallarchaeota archaeon]